ncbi:GumC family protein, partial [Singulisphaera rosea]
MDGLQPYAAPSRLPSHPVPHPSSKLAKGPADYIRALRRRVWAVLAIGVPLSILGAIWTARQPNVYSAKAVIQITAPGFDDHLKTLISKSFGGNDSSETSKDYIQNRVAMLKSRALAERVINDPSLVQGAAPPPDAADELIGALQFRPIPTTNQYTVSLEGGDPERVTKQLKLMLDFFVEDASNEITSKINTSQSFAESSIDTLKGELQNHKKLLEDMLTKSGTIGPGGKNLKQTEYETKIGSMAHKESQLTDLQQQTFLSQSMPSSKRSLAQERRDVKLGDLERAREELTSKLEPLHGKIRGYNSDPSVRALSARLRDVLDRIEKLQNAPLPNDEGPNLHESLLEAKRAEIAKDEQLAQELLGELRASMPEHQKYLDMLDEQRQKTEQINAMMTKLWEFKAVAQSRRVPVAVLSAPSEPTSDSMIEKIPLRIIGQSSSVALTRPAYPLR